MNPTPNKNNRKNNKEEGSFQPNDFYKYSGMAIKMAVVIAAGVYGGMALDERYGGETPWFTLGLSLIGVGAAVYIVIKEAS